MLFESYKTKLTPFYINITVNSSNTSGSNVTLSKIWFFAFYSKKIKGFKFFFWALNGYQVTPGFTNGPNLLGILVFSIILGNIIADMGHKGVILNEIIDKLGQCFSRLIEYVIWFVLKKKR